MEREYPGYPSYVILAMPKSGTKTMNAVFSALGFKVFDLREMNDYAIQVCSFNPNVVGRDS